MHDHLALRVLIAPSHNSAVHLFRADPRLGAMRTRAHGKILILFAAENALPLPEMPRRADHARRRRRSLIFHYH